MILRKLFVIIVKTFSNTNLEMSMLIKREKRSVPVDVRSSKNGLFMLKAPY